MNKNKKGQEFLVDIFSYLLFIMIVLIFMILLVRQTASFKNNLAMGVSADYYNTRLLILLRQPISGTKQTVAEMIIDSQYDNAKKQIVMQEIKNAFDLEVNDKWYITVYLKKSTVKEVELWNVGHSYNTQALLPSLYQGIINAITKEPMIAVPKASLRINLPGYNSEDIIVEFEYWVILI